jgi:quinone-modifying oxidoreductase subunit QmoA
MEKTTQSILVVGGGISGATTAIEAAEAGYEVVLVEKLPYLGGRVAQMHQYFPKLCPPYCGLEINFKRMRENRNVRFFTMSEVTGITGEEGNFEVTIKTSPRYINENCTGCGKCASAIETTIDNPFNYGMDKIKAAYLPHNLSFPMRYVLDPSIIGSDDGKKCADACEVDAVDLEMQETTFTLNVGSVVWATGWEPYDPAKIAYYNYEDNSNLISNVMMERLASAGGPTQGKILRPSDGKEVNNIAFVQCAGSRDENNLAYCSDVCCMASLKQATYMREQFPDSKVTIFFIDIRAMERLEDFYVKVQDDENVTFVKSKIAKITQDAATGDVLLEGEDTIENKKFVFNADMAVLATGMVPNTKQAKVPTDISYDEYGFIPADSGKPGIHSVGTGKRPADVSASVQSGTAAALKAIQSISRR